MAKARRIGGLAANNTGRAKLPNKLTTKPPSGKSVYNIPKTTARRASRARGG